MSSVTFVDPLDEKVPKKPCDGFITELDYKKKGHEQPKKLV